MTDLPCGKNKFIQFCKSVYGACGLVSKANNNPSIDSPLYHSGVWNDHNVDVATQRVRNNFVGVYDKGMDTFLRPANSGCGNYEYRHCKVLTAKKKELLAQNGDLEDVKSIKCYDKVVYVDCIGFKCYNDYLSELVGDEIIAVIANHLRDNWKQFFVTRKGGDEFLLYHMNNLLCGNNENIQESINNCDIAEKTIEELHKIYSEEFLLKEYTLFIPEPSSDADCVMQTGSILEDADAKDYLFKYSIRGFKYRYGIGYSPNSAWKDSSARKTKEKTTPRGMFEDSVCVKLGNAENWIRLNTNVVLVIRNHGDYVNLKDRVTKMLTEEGYCLDVVKDSINSSEDSVYFIILADCKDESENKNNFEIGTERKERLLELAKVIKQKQKTDLSGSLLRDDELDAVYLLSGVTLREFCINGQEIEENRR